MSDWKFDSDREPFVYILPTFGYGYGHLKACFRLPVGTFMGDKVEVVLTSQISRSSVDDQVSLYAIRFELETAPFRYLEAALAFKRKLDRKTGNRAEHLGGDGIEVWIGFLNAALDAWGIKHAHLFQRTDDHRAIPDTPYYGRLNRPTERIALLNDVRRVYETQLVAKLAPAKEVA